MFNFAGMEITTAINGHQAFEILSKSMDFDLVVLDLDMPISNGYETCSNIVKLYKKLFQQDS
jgi:two-component system sensor histidine kinase/response regulator